MNEPIAYHPQTSLEHLRAFNQRVSQCPGSWTAMRSFAHAGDPRILSLRWIVPDSRWCTIPGYLAFLDQRQHRLLLRCFVRQAQKRSWSFDELHYLLDIDNLEAVLAFCAFQEFHVSHEELWYPGPRMEKIQNLGATFEWLVMENLQRFYQVVARRSVTFQEREE